MAPGTSNRSGSRYASPSRRFSHASHRPSSSFLEHMGMPRMTPAQYHADRWSRGFSNQPPPQPSSYYPQRSSSSHGRHNSYRAEASKSARHRSSRQGSRKTSHRTISPPAIPGYRLGRPNVSRSSRSGRRDSLVSIPPPDVNSAMRNLDLSHSASRGRQMERSAPRSRVHRPPTPTGRPIHEPELPGIVYGCGPVPGRAVSLSGHHSPYKSRKPLSTIDEVSSGRSIRMSVGEGTRARAQEYPQRAVTSGGGVDPMYVAPSNVTREKYPRGHHTSCWHRPRQPTARSDINPQELRPEDSISQVGSNPLYSHHRDQYGPISPRYVHGGNDDERQRGTGASIGMARGSMGGASNRQVVGINNKCDRERRSNNV